MILMLRYERCTITALPRRDWFHTIHNTIRTNNSCCCCCCYCCRFDVTASWCFLLLYHATLCPSSSSSSSSSSSDRYDAMIILVGTAEVVELLHNNDIDIQNKTTYLLWTYRIWFECYYQSFDYRFVLLLFLFYLFFCGIPWSCCKLCFLLFFWSGTTDCKVVSSSPSFCCCFFFNPCFVLVARGTAFRVSVSTDSTVIRCCCSN